jgi:hypothetical protein
VREREGEELDIEGKWMRLLIRLKEERDIGRHEQGKLMIDLTEIQG